MDQTTFPFPLAVASSHHSNYHRFLLGAAPSVIAPLPKPYCIGALTAPLRGLAENLDLPRWRKLYHGAFPWTAGFGREHYGLGVVPPHRPLPAEYRRPSRRFGAFDFVQVADPAYSAIALVGGDRRAIERFAGLGDTFGNQVQSGARASASSLSACPATGRLLAGQFVEPNNRWLMPLLHVHTRVLNFTSLEQDPERMFCLDAAALGRRGEQLRSGWIRHQADALEELGYCVSACTQRGLTVRGVSSRLLAAMEAPRIAVLRILERMVSGNRPPSADRLTADLPMAVVAGLADRIERMLTHPLSPFKPAKLGIPFRGPWRESVREHLSGTCSPDLRLLDEACARAHAIPSESAVFCAAPDDAAHAHCPQRHALDAPCQMPSDPELGIEAAASERPHTAPAWLMRDFANTLDEVHRRLAHFGADDPLIDLRRLLPHLDTAAAGANSDQIAQVDAFLGAELGRHARSYDREPAANRMHSSLVPLDELFPEKGVEAMACDRERGGRCP